MKEFGKILSQYLLHKLEAKLVRKPNLEANNY